MLRSSCAYGSELHTTDVSESYCRCVGHAAQSGGSVRQTRMLCRRCIRAYSRFYMVGARVLDTGLRCSSAYLALRFIISVSDRADGFHFTVQDEGVSFRIDSECLLRDVPGCNY